MAPVSRGAALHNANMPGATYGRSPVEPSPIHRALNHRRCKNWDKQVIQKVTDIQKKEMQIVSFKSIPPAQIQLLE